MTDETIFEEFEEALQIYITLESFTLSKGSNRKRSSHIVTAQSFTSTTWIDCNDGWGGVKERCVRCPTGYRSNEDARYPCVPCPVGKYNDERGQKLCKDCPLRTSTPSEGTTSADQCLELCTVPSIKNGNPFPFVNFNISIDKFITITCNANPVDENDESYYALEYGQNNTVICSSKLPDCFRTCKLKPLPEHLLYMGKLKVNETIRYKQKIPIKCSDGSSVSVACSENGEIPEVKCGTEYGAETPYLQYTLIAVTVAAFLICVSITLARTCVKLTRKVKEKATLRKTKTVALATNIYNVQEKIVLSRPFSSESFLKHVQVISIN